MDKGDTIFVAGHRGLVGSAILRRLERDGFTNLLTRTHAELDLTRQADVEAFFKAERPQHVFLAAAKVGGILANRDHPAEFIAKNLEMQTHVIDSAHRFGTEKLCFLDSSCIYPRMAPQPIPEDALLTGPLESTNDAYAIAKIAGITMCQAYRRQYGFDAISLMPTNLYGPGDNFDPEQSHVLPGLMRRFHEAKEEGQDEVVVWGTGRPRREFLHVDDLADACLHFMQEYSGDRLINIGHGKDLSIAELARLIAEVVEYGGKIAFDTSRPDGTPRKLLDTSRATGLGWTPGIGLREGLEETYTWFREHVASGDFRGAA